MFNRPVDGEEMPLVLGLLFAIAILSPIWLPLLIWLTA
jgi:hypothetical protein